MKVKRLIHFVTGINQQWNYSPNRIVIVLVLITTVTSLFYLNMIDRYSQYVLTIGKIIYKPSFSNVIATYPSTFQRLDKDFFESTNGYLVYSPSCRIPNISINTPQVVPLIEKLNYKPCSKYPVLTKIGRNGNDTVLIINEKATKSYVKKAKKFKCCYSRIERDYSEKVPDDNIRMSLCTYFTVNITLNPADEFILVKCYNNGKQIYKNTHSILRVKEPAVERVQAFKDKQPNTFNVLIIGIDSVSRLNFHRSMPKTMDYLTKKDWNILNGYNKIDDNTFPNLMAVFTGFNSHMAYNICAPSELTKLDKCPMIFYKYRDQGYITAYAEDAAYINTFNYNKVGFVRPPTDYYLRPYMIASEKQLKVGVVDEMKYCLGPEAAGERILNYAYDFVNVVKTESFFGFFWTNTFSHNNINSPSRMDTKVRNWFEKLETTGIHNNTIIIFLSDHGLRFGRILETESGWFEERLPMIYFWIPHAFRERFPREYENFLANKNHLTTPYDLHMTLKDILVKSDRNYTPTVSDACPKCRSLFELAEFNRSCDDAAIDLHWCTCHGFVKVRYVDDIIKNGTQEILDYINQVLQENKQAKKNCVYLTLDEIVEARHATFFQKPSSHLFIVIFTVKPSGGKFEGTVEYENVNGTHSYDVKGYISRINSYFGQSNCIHNSHLQKYCYCK